MHTLTGTNAAPSPSRPPTDQNALNDCLVRTRRLIIPQTFWASINIIIVTQPHQHRHNQHVSLP